MCCMKEVLLSNHSSTTAKMTLSKALRSKVKQRGVQPFGAGLTFASHLDPYQFVKPWKKHNNQRTFVSDEVLGTTTLNFVVYS